MNVAELLLDLARDVRYPRDLLLVPEDNVMGDVQFAKIRLALELLRLPPEVRLRAVVEDWTLPQIVAAVW